ncbi:MAG: hypothetical protein LBH12_03105 [Dysgonamonadaceae bacterium]|jgi:uncharacterized protein (TIGR02145 family)|nr:hypothetical protein [Dysgonamonadaceae bacterium]
MKSTTPTNGQATSGSSKLAEAGGFNALLVGAVGSGSRYGFGTHTYFWSSSSYDAYYAWNRNLTYSYEGVNRIYNSRSALFSVRCKKDN